MEWIGGNCKILQIPGGFYRNTFVYFKRKPISMSSSLPSTRKGKDRSQKQGDLSNCETAPEQDSPPAMLQSPVQTLAA